MGGHPLEPPGVYAPLVVEWCVLEVDYEDYNNKIRVCFARLKMVGLSEPETLGLSDGGSLLSGARIFQLRMRRPGLPDARLRPDGHDEGSAKSFAKMLVLLRTPRSKIHDPRSKVRERLCRDPAVQDPRSGRPCW